jgi:hypothetical protein
MEGSAMAWPEDPQSSHAAAGPFDAWLVPRHEMSMRPSAGPIDAPVAKLGGRPVWLDEPFWPVSRTSGMPMTFVGQFPLPGPSPRLSYLFLAQDDDEIAATFEPDSGENALLVQPGGIIPAFVIGVAVEDGPSLWRRGSSWTERVPVELFLDADPPTGAAERAYLLAIAQQSAERAGTYLAADDEEALERRSFVGGQPLFWQPTTSIGRGWRFFFQLDGAEGWGDDLYALNFGGGTGYAFLSQNEREGRFLWDCV